MHSFYWLSDIPLCIYVPQLSYPFVCWWTSRLLPCPGYCKQSWDEHWGTRVSFSSGFLGVYAQQWECCIIFVFWMLSFKPDFSLSPFTFINRLFSSSSLSAIRVVSSAIQPSNPTAGHTHRGNQNWKRHVYPNVHRSTVYNSRTCKQPRCPLADEWIRKQWYIYTMEY